MGFSVTSWNDKHHREVSWLEVGVKVGIRKVGRGREQEDDPIARPRPLAAARGGPLLRDRVGPALDGRRQAP